MPGGQSGPALDKLVVSGIRGAYNIGDGCPNRTFAVLRSDRCANPTTARVSCNAVLELHYAELEYTNQFGEVLTKAQWLDNIGAEKLKHVSFDHKVANLHIYGDAAVLTGFSHTVFEYKGTVSKTPRRFTRFFVKQGGKWLLVGQHVTAIAER